MPKIYKETKDNIICKICNKECKYLGIHIWHAHKIKARDYKKTYQLDYNFPLISLEVMNKKRIAFEENKDKYLLNLRGHKSIANRFKNGNKNRSYFSKQSIERVTEIIKNQDLSGICPYCGTKFENIHNHLRLKHNVMLLNLDKIKE